MDNPETQQTALFLWKTAQSLSVTCPAASRYYMSTLSKHIGNSLISTSFVKSHQFCKYCGSLWSYSNYKIRIQPIPPPNLHIKKLLKLEKEQPWKLNNRQKKKLKKYKESTNKIIYSCNACKKATTFTGLKKYCAKEQDMSINTPVQKIKLKKGDLNAGLFIKTPTEKKIQDEVEINIQGDKSPNEVSSQSLLTTDLITPYNKEQTTEIHFSLEKRQKNVTPQITSSSKKKKRKGLLAQILNQEQEAKKQKKTLSSFLTSL